MQYKKKYIIFRTDDRPLIWENFKWPYLREGSSDPLHVWFLVGFSGWADRMALFPAGPSSIGRPMQEKTMRDESLDWSQSKVFLVTICRFALLINYRMLYTQMDCQLWMTYCRWNRCGRTIIQIYLTILVAYNCSDDNVFSYIFINIYTYTYT